MTMHYVVIDTNVIVSALLAQDHQQSIPFTILEAVFLGKITPVLSKDIVAEYISVLNREKFGFDKDSEIKSDYHVRLPCPPAPLRLRGFTSLAEKCSRPKKPPATAPLRHRRQAIDGYNFQR